MSHLSPERLASLSDDTPSPIEAAHITTCDTCSAEVAAQRRLARLAAAAQVIAGAPISNFDSLAPRLRAEGVIAAEDRAARVRVWAVRVAASLVLVLGGAVAGRLTASRELPMLPDTPVASGAAAASPAGGIQPVSTFGTVDDAMRVATVSQQNYSKAAAFLAAQDTTARFIGLNQDTYRTRLVALDAMLAATRAALYQAPQDPMLNHYYLGATSARELTLAQLRESMPASRALRGY